MGLWTFYFIGKLYLHYRGLIKFDVLANLLFLAFVVLPLPGRWRGSLPARAAKHGLSAVVGILLLWRDSWLPDPAHAVRLLRQHGLPSAEYMFQFFLRLWNVKVLAVLAGIFVLSFLVRRFRKTAAVGTAALLCLPLVIAAGTAGRRSPAEVERATGAFFNAESTRHQLVAPPAAGGPGFDILILQICSLSWDDLRELGMLNHAFFRQFDVLFSNFNTVTTYSNPAVIRLLNSNCGQRRHGDLYTSQPLDCSLMDGLRRQGFAARFARNHNGVYGKFDDEVRRFGHLTVPPFEPSGITARKYMFDDSPVYDDYAVLEQWWADRRKDREKQVALYYNSVSLHDGSHWIKDREWWKRDNREEYREFLYALLSDLEKFFNLVAASGRDVVVVVVGEHGRAVRGNVIETPGLRDVPLPRITLVPVGIKIIGKDAATRGSAGRSVVIDKPTSYFDIAFVLHAFGEQSPFRTDRYTTRAFIDSVPQTPFVAENENNLVIRIGDEHYFYGKDRKWLFLSEEALR